MRAIGSDLHMDYTAVSQTTNLAARMEQLATLGSTLLSAEFLRGSTSSPCSFAIPIVAVTAALADAFATPTDFSPSTKEPFIASS